MITAGYAEEEEATTDSSRGGWFHTGDQGALGARAGGPLLLLQHKADQGSCHPGEGGEHLTLRDRRGPPQPPSSPVLAGDPRSRTAPTSVRLPRTSSAMRKLRRRTPLRTAPGTSIMRGVRRSLVDNVPYTATGRVKRLELKSRLAPLLAEYRDTQCGDFARPLSPTLRASGRPCDRRRLVVTAPPTLHRSRGTTCGTPEALLDDAVAQRSPRPRPA
jgi:long-chain acyl-CoA synthetase